MSRMLNSSEKLEMNDSFQLSFTHVRKAPSGSGHKRKMKPGYTNPETFKRFKHSVITFKNEDELCCARAIVTAKAKLDDHPKWHGFQKGTKIQNDQAILLHITKNYKNLHWHHPCTTTNFSSWMPCVYTVSSPSVHPGTNRLPSCTTMVATMSSPDCRDSSVAVISVPAVSNLTTMKDNTHARTTQIIVVPVCKRPGCPDYTEAKCRGHRVTLPCGSCKRLFYGDICFQNHLSKSYNGKSADAANVSVCTQRRKCIECQKQLVGLKEQREHKCGYKTRKNEKM